MAANSNSPAFNPPMNRLIDEDPQIVKVPMDKVDWAFRKTQPPTDAVKASEMRVQHIGSK